MGLADLAGSWPIHYRDKDTGMPVRLDDYPYMSLLGNPGDKVNPKTGKSEAFPACASQADCKSPYTPDSAHQPSMGYLAYVVGGDYDHLEELMFWANYNMLESNPHYRAFEQGLLKWGQVRGQAWSLRTLGFAAYIVPDDHSFKAYFNPQARGPAHAPRLVEEALRRLHMPDAMAALRAGPLRRGPVLDEIKVRLATESG